MDEGQYECWCGHVLDWHAERAFNYACTVDGCACKTFQGDRRAAERPTPASEPQPMPGPRREVEYCSCGGTTVTEYDENGRMSWGGNCLHLDGVEYHKIPAPKIPPALDDTDARIAAIERRRYSSILEGTLTDEAFLIAQVRDARAECSRLRATLDGTTTALDASEQERRILIDHAAALSATLDAREAERARLYGIVEEAIVGVEHGWTNTQALTFRERCRTALPSRAAASLSEEPNP